MLSFIINNSPILLKKMKTKQLTGGWTEEKIKEMEYLEKLQERMNVKIPRKMLTEEDVLAEVNVIKALGFLKKELTCYPTENRLNQLVKDPYVVEVVKYVKQQEDKLFKKLGSETNDFETFVYEFISGNIKPESPEKSSRVRTSKQYKQQEKKVATWSKKKEKFKMNANIFLTVLELLEQE